MGPGTRLTFVEIGCNITAFLAIMQQKRDNITLTALFLTIDYTGSIQSPFFFIN